jgi:hypothetical protein
MKNQVLTQIKSLSFHLEEEDGNAEAVLYVLNRLELTLDSVSNINFDSNEELKDFVLGESDPLTDNIDCVSDSFKQDVREIQHMMINYYSV